MPVKPSIDRMFKAFADETRLRILHVLTRRELCVCDLMETLKLPQPKVSRHLAYLRAAGLVHVRKQGLWKHYSLIKPQGKSHRGLMNCIQHCFQEVAILRQDLAKLNQLKRTTC